MERNENSRKILSQNTFSRKFDLTICQLKRKFVMLYKICYMKYEIYKIKTEIISVLIVLNMFNHIHV